MQLVVCKAIETGMILLIVDVKKSFASKEKYFAKSVCKRITFATWSITNIIKFRYSEKAKFCSSSTFCLTLFSSPCLVASNCKFKWKMGQTFVAFSEYLNLTCFYSLGWCGFKNSLERVLDVQKFKGIFQMACML